MPKPLRGLALLDATLHFIEEHPEAYDQSVWGELPSDYCASASVPDAEDPMPCGTTACLAGWAAYLGGARITWDPDDGTMYANKNYVRATAADFLGIPFRKAIWRDGPYTTDRPGLFAADNSLTDLHALRDAIAEGTY